MSAADIPVTTALIAIGAMTIGCAFQAALGIGMALFVVPVLALVEPRFIPGPMLLAGALLTAASAYAERDALQVKGLGAAFVGLAAGTVIGAAALHFVAGANVQRVFGALILVAVGVSVSVGGGAVTINSRNLLLGGGASGVMGTMVGIHGPAISLVFQQAEPRFARAMLGTFFTVAYLGSVAALALVGLFGAADLLRAAVLLPGVVAGLLLAPLARRFIDRKRLRVAILAVAAISGVLLVLK